MNQNNGLYCIHIIMFNKYKMDLQVKAPNNFSDSYTLNEAIALFYQKNGFEAETEIEYYKEK
mgnify:CR=1 FL=1